MSSVPSYLVIGAGVFGASTAYHLTKKFPSADVRLVDRTPYPCPLAASWDWNKVVRADYGDLFYMEKALEAIHIWRTDPLWRPFYHESGLINIDNTGLGRRMIENYKTLKVDIQPEMVNPEDFRKRYGGFFADTDLSSVEEIFVNVKSGWAEASKALEAMTDTAVSAGVNYIQGSVASLTFDESGAKCTGVQMTDGSQLWADRIILSTGAGTAKLLADSAPERPALQIGDRMTAAAVVTGVVKCNGQEGKAFQGIPVGVHGISETRGEVMPLQAEKDGEHTVKFCRDESFKNTLHHEASGQAFSTPPNEIDQDQWNASTGLRARLETVMKGILGEERAKRVNIDTYRVCWDAVTPNQDFIISSHPHCANLFFATGGSFHGWKFMPTIGRYVVELLEGTLDLALVKRWAWDRDNQGSAHGDLLPALELKDL